MAVGGLLRWDVYSGRWDPGELEATSDGDRFAVATMTGMLVMTAAPAGVTTPAWVVQSTPTGINPLPCGYRSRVALSQGG